VIAVDNIPPLSTVCRLGDFATHPARRGDVLTIYAIGLGPTDPSVATGAAAPASPPLAGLRVTPTVVFGGGIGATAVAPLFAGLTPQSAGLYQVNVQIPEEAPLGAYPISLSFPDSVSNSVLIAVE
jgi:uncharacterized protein (TIGR03437 family)